MNELLRKNCCSGSNGNNICCRNQLQRSSRERRRRGPTLKIRRQWLNGGGSNFIFQLWRVIFYIETCSRRFIHPYVSFVDHVCCNQLELRAKEHQPCSKNAVPHWQMTLTKCLHARVAADGVRGRGVSLHIFDRRFLTVFFVDRR